MEWLLIGGAAVIGFMIPEWVATLAKLRIPVLQHVVSAVGFAMIATFIAFHQ